MSGSRTVIQVTHATLLVSALAVLTMPHGVNAQAHEMPGTIEAVVLDGVTRQAVASAKVTATVNGRTALTDVEGRFKLDAVAGGLVDLTVRAAGYADLTEKGVCVRPGELTTLTLALDPHSPESATEPREVGDAHSTRSREKTIPFGFGVGLAGERRMASDTNASDVWGLALLIRFIGRGLGPAFNLPWTDTGEVTELGSGSTELGVIRIRPTMVGLMWQEPLGNRTSAEIQFVAGYSFNSVGKSGRKSLKARVAVPQAVIAIDDSFAWETRVAAWQELGPRMGFVVAGRYLHTRPQFTFADGPQRVWKADRITVEAGFAFTQIKAPWTRNPSSSDRSKRSEHR
jgi:Carboxypeptidase regulatory-like domain